MATYTAKVLNLIKGMLTTSNGIPKRSADGSLVDSKLSDSGTALSYNSNEVLDKRNLTTANNVPKLGTGNQLSPSLVNDDGTKLTYNSNEVLDSRLQRKKTEVYYSGASVVLTAGNSVNLVTILKALTPVSGTLAPFFDTTTNKLKVINDNSSCAFKLNIVGNWANASGNGSLQLNFLGTNGNRLEANRTSATTGDSLTLATFLSVDKNGNLATNGSTVEMTAIGIDFTITSALLIAEQVTKETF